MKKMYEVWGDKEGIIFKSIKKEYHFLVGVDTTEEQDNIKIGNASDAIKLLIDLFQKEMNIDISKEEIISPNKFKSDIHITYNISLK